MEVDAAASSSNNSNTSADVFSSSSSGQRTWGGFAWMVAGKLGQAWACFDRVAGRLLGLDLSKYEAAVLEHKIRLKEEEEAMLDASIQRQQVQRTSGDAEEGQASIQPTDAPPTASMRG